MRIAIVGAGQAGASVAARLRALGHDGPVTLIGDEPAAPYQRPPLSKAYLLGEMPAERLALRAPEFWADQRITLRLGAPVLSLDAGALALTLGDGVVQADRIVLATGARPRRLPEAMGGGMDGVHVVRTLADVDQLAPEVVAGRRALIVGGGYIGLEAAAVAAGRGLEVTLIEAAPRILNRVACAETADWFRDLHAARGVRILEGVGLARLTGGPRVTGAELADGRQLPCDLVIAGIGIEPETTLASAAGLALDNGIAVDAFGQTSAPGIWAAGDCASFPHGGGRLRLESVPNAIDMGECVAENILGAGKVYVPKPWFWSDQYDVKLQIAGLGAGHDRIIRRATGAARSHWYYRGAQLLAVDAMNDPRAFMIARRLIDAGRSADPAIVADPQADLRALM